MTMKRDAKAEITGKYAARKSGARVEDSRSPRQYAAFGPVLPTDVAARFFLAYERVSTRRTRADWATARIRFAEPTRDRVVHLPGAYRPRHAA